MLASMVTPNAVCYDAGDVRYNDYGGKALSAIDFRRDSVTIVSRDYDLLYEVAYLVVQSRVGERLDRRGVHRLHALGLIYSFNGNFVPLPIS